MVSPSNKQLCLTLSSQLLLFVFEVQNSLGKMRNEKCHVLCRTKADCSMFVHKEFFMISKDFYFLVIFQPMCTLAVCDIKVKIIALLFCCDIRRNKEA